MEKCCLIAWPPLQTPFKRTAAICEPPKIETLLTYPRYLGIAPTCSILPMYWFGSKFLTAALRQEDSINLLLQSLDQIQMSMEYITYRLWGFARGTWQGPGC